MLSRVKKLFEIAYTHAGFKLYLKNTSWLFGGQIFNLLIGLSVSVAVARHLGPEDFGLFHFVLSVVGLLGVTSQLGLTQLTRREMVELPEQRNEIIGTCFVLSSIMGISIYCLMLLAIFTQADRNLVKCLFALLGCQMLLSSFDYIDIWFQSQIRSSLSVIASSASAAIFAILKIVAIVQGADLLVFGYLFVFELITGCLFKNYLYGRHFGSILRWAPSWYSVRNLLGQSWPLAFAGLAAMLFMKIDQVMLGAIIGDKAVGHYAVAVKISSFSYFIPSVLAISLFPAILKTRRESKALYEKRLQSYFDLNAGLAYLIVIPLSIAGPQVIRILFGEAYRPAGAILSIHVWSCLFIFLGIARSQYLTAERMFKFSMGSTIAGALLNVLLNFLLIPAYLGYGAAIATLISYAVSTFFSSFFNANLANIGKQQTRAMFIPIRFLNILS